MSFHETEAVCVKSGTFYRKLKKYNIVSISKIKNIILKNDIQF